MNLLAVLITIRALAFGVDLDPSRAARIADSVLIAQRETGLDSALILGVIEAESHYKVSALSPVGAIGLMQVMPRTAKSVCSSWFELRRIEHNIRIGSRYLAYLVGIYGNIGRALTAYNIGMGKVNSSTVTNAYAHKVLRIQRYYQKRIAKTHKWRNNVVEIGL
jgi:soluble lytic murein transglycosylase-like protein